MRWWQVMHVLTVTILQHRQSNRIMPSILPHRKRVKDLAYPLKLYFSNQLSGAAGSKARSWFSSSQCHCAIFPEGGCKHSLNQPSLQESTRYGCWTIYISVYSSDGAQKMAMKTTSGNGLKYKSVPQFFELLNYLSSFINTMQGPPPPPTEVPFSRCCFGGVHTWW